jgi:tetratricopeptide (TPR) repeat protein
MALAAAVAILTLASFLPSLGGQFVNYDDDVNFLDNPHYRGLGPEHLKWMFTHHFGHYMPLTWMSLGLDYVIWGMNPFGYHLTNVILHTTNAVLCFFLLGQLLRRSLPGGSPERLGWTACAGALFFSIHPLRVESVAWITERRDLMSGVFFLLSLLAYLRSTQDVRRWRWLGCSVAAFACSMLCKAMGMTLPLVLLVLDAWPLRRYERERPRSVILEKLPYFAVMAVAAALSAWAQNTAKAVYSIHDYPLTQSLAQPGYRLWFYVQKTLLPLGLSPLYFYRPALGPAHVAGGIAILAITVFLLSRRRRYPAAAVAWASFLLLIAPVSGFAQAGPHFAADRYTYLACLPFAALFAGALALGAGSGARRAVATAAVLALAGLGGLTVRQCGIWRTSITLWDRAIWIEPDVYFSLRNRGSAKLDRLDWAGALADFDRAVELNPRYPNSWYGRGVARTPSRPTSIAA